MSCSSSSNHQTPLSSTSPSTRIRSKTKRSSRTSQSSNSPSSVQSPNTCSNGSKCPSTEPIDNTSLWTKIQSNPDDFHAWTQLLDSFDKNETFKDMDLIRNSFNYFLSLYPYCFGYWKKWSEIEMKASFTNKARDVLIRGTQSITLSVDLWVHYLTVFIPIIDKDQSSQEAMDLFDEAIKSCGQEFKSDPIWHMYFNWLDKNHMYKKMQTVYDKLFKVPIKHLLKYFSSFEKFVFKCHPAVILSLEEYEDHLKEIGLRDQKKNTSANSGSFELDSKEHCITPNKKERDLIRARIIKMRKAVMKVTYEKVKAICQFENMVRRPYFHINPIDSPQLENWVSYLDWAIRYPYSFEDIVILFERCLISCCLYQEFWLKYISYLRNVQVPAVQISAIFQRACYIHLRRSKKLYYAWFFHEEEQGDFNKAIEILDHYEQSVPGMLETKMIKANALKRHGMLDEADEYLQASIKDAETDDRAFAFLSSLYARFIYRVKKQSYTAIDIIEKALEKDPNNSYLYMQIINILYEEVPMDIKGILEIFDRALIELNNESERKMFIQRKFTFMDEFTTDIAQLNIAYLATKEDNQNIYDTANMAYYLKRDSSVIQNQDCTNGIIKQKKQKQNDDAVDVIPVLITRNSMEHTLDHNSYYY